MNETLRVALVAALLVGCSTRPSPGGTTGGGGAGGTSGAPPRLGNGALIFWGEGGIPPGVSHYLIGPIDALVSTLGSIPVPVTQSGDWPADLTQFRLVLWYAPGAAKADGFAVSPDRVDALRGYLHAGGRLVVAGDIDGGFAGYSLTNADLVIDQLMSSLDVNLRIEHPAAVSSPASCPSGVSDPLLNGVDRIAWNAAHPLGVGPPATWMACETLAVETVGCGELILIGDTQPVSDQAGGNPQLIVNFATLPSRSACP